MAAKTVFVMLYAGAVEGTDRWLRPDQVTKMTNSQSARTDASSREKWAALSSTSGAMKHVGGRWYAANTREPIRDETLRAGLVAVGAVVERPGLPTTSAKPRYALARDFVDLLVKLKGGSDNALALISAWQAAHLTATALNRINLMRRGAVLSPTSQRVMVALPNGETRSMLPGPSSVITKAVVEELRAPPRWARPEISVLLWRGASQWPSVSSIFDCVRPGVRTLHTTLSSPLRLAVPP
jgi:hypothetical protein